MDTTTFRVLPKNIKDITFQKFNRLLALRYVASVKGRAYWEFACDCGNSLIAAGKAVRSGKTQSCGCRHRERFLSMVTKHGKVSSHSYRLWSYMRSRCGNPNIANYKHYGGRGIKVCERWQVFENFLADMGEPPTPQHSLDRIDVNGDYSPDNCRWATMKEQARNRRVNAYYEVNGRVQCLSAWAEETGLCRSAIRERLRKGWTVEEALTRPSRKKKKVAG